MAKKKIEKTPLVKKNWTSNFTLIGEAKVGDYTFNLDQHSEKSDWIYNRMSLGVDCGEKYGTVFAELMGGFGSERGDQNVIYVHGKKDDGSDDFENSYTIHWDDRFEEDILKEIGDLCFLTVGLEKDVKDKTVYKKFLSAYDAIAYIQEHLTEGTAVNVKGQLKYSIYNDTVQCKKEINSVVLSSATPDKYRASFVQTMWLDKDSCTKSSINKEKSVLEIYAYVAEKFKEYNGYDLTDGGKIKGGQVVPLRKVFEYNIPDLTKGEAVKKVMDKVFKVQKGVTQITFEGEFVESGAAVTATLDDIPDDIKELIEMGMYTEEEALARCSENGNKERRMIITRPVFRMVGDDDNKVPQILREEEKYTDEDLLLECLIKKEEEDEEDEVDTSDDSDDSEDAVADANDMSWLDNLD